MRKVLFFALILLSAASAFAQKSAPFDLTEYGVRVEPDRRLMTVLASLEAAGIDTPLTPKGAEFRTRVRADLETVNPELRQKIKNFFDQYKRRHPNQTPGELIAPFVSMAYSLSPVPDLSDPARATDLPGDLLEVLDYAPLVREFYRRLTGAKIDEYVKIYQAEDQQLRRSAAAMVGELLNYLHTKPQITYIERIKTESKPAKNKKKTLQQTEIRERARRFFVVPEMLAPRGTVNFLNIGDDYFAVVPPETDLSQSEVRRAYLQFVVDALVLSNAKDVLTMNDGIRVLLAERRKENPNVSPDPFLAVSRSLVAAADARQIEYKKSQIATAQARRKIDLLGTDEEKRKVSAELEAFKKSLADETAVQLSESYEKGAVLAFYFADQLKGLENSGFDIASSFRDIILSLDTTKEVNRLPQFAEARTRATAAREARKSSGENTNQNAAVNNPVTVKLLNIDKIIQNKNYPAARVSLNQLLDANPNESPRIYYTLGRLSSLQAEGVRDENIRNQHLLDAKVAYENVLRTATGKIDADDTVSINVNSTEKGLAETALTLLSRSYVALGRIYEYDGEDEYAAKIYEAAVKLGKVPDGAYDEAVDARDRLLKKVKN
ncbi:MAG: hypothetical protein M3525_01675 [Acidobacteriota bacterium]|nr:hypothetical protein [Acidobacteriota bacterium]